MLRSGKPKSNEWAVKGVRFRHLTWSYRDGTAERETFVYGPANSSFRARRVFRDGSSVMTGQRTIGSHFVTVDRYLSRSGQQISRRVSMRAVGDKSRGQVGPWLQD